MNNPVRHYKAVYFYSNEDNGQLYQGWGSDGPFDVEDGKFTLEVLNEIQQSICERYKFDQCLIINMIEVDG